ncbi:MAG TPA: glucokinase [Paracoccaceae bacterium]|nr:glucokinase [Paracoccaceae bacterium]
MRLIADIGGTNARFALCGPDGVRDVQILPVADFPDFAAAMAAFLGAGREVASAAIAAAGPRDGDAVSLTNAPWRIAAGEVSRALGGAPVRVLNDLEAVALGLPGLSAEDVEPIAETIGGTPAGGSAGGAALPMLAANIGTGFGAAVAVPGPGGWIALGTEAGHISLVPATPGEEAMLRAARSVEDAFSGPAYAKLFGGAVRDGGETVHPVRDTALGEERHLYSRVFGRVLGDLVLATGAWGGVWLCGGVVTDFHRIFDCGEFLRAFRRKSRMAARMERVPVFRITLDAPALHSLATVPVP